MSNSTGGSGPQIGGSAGPSLELVEEFVNPRASDALLGELYAQTVLAILVALTGAFILALKLVKAGRAARAGLPNPYGDLWLFRRLHKPKGTYVVTNSLFVWTITTTVVGATMATAVILTTKTFSGVQNFDNLNLWDSAPLQGMGPGAWQVMVGTVLTFFETNQSLSLPAPWIFHLFAYALPLALYGVGMALSVMVNSKVVMMRELAQDALAAGNSADIVTSLIATFQVAADILREQKRLTMGLTSLSFVWLGLLTIFSILPGVAVIQALRKTIKATNINISATSGSEQQRRISLDFDAERRRTTVKRKHQYMLSFFGFSLTWVIAFLVVLTVHFATLTDTSSADFMKLSIDEILRMQFVDVYYVALVGMLVLGVALMGRELYSFSESSHAGSMLARVGTMSQISTVATDNLDSGEEVQNIKFQRSQDRLPVFMLSAGPGGQGLGLRSPRKLSMSEAK